MHGRRQTAPKPCECLRAEKGHRCRDVSGLGEGGFNDLGEVGKVLKPGVPAHIVEMRGGLALACLRRHFFTLGELTQRKVVGRSVHDPMTYEELKATKVTVRKNGGHPTFDRQTCPTPLDI